MNTVLRAITGFHQDDDSDWVAELSCGHDQHVRHRPPFHELPWVSSDTGRSEHIGKALECPFCDRAELPAQLRLLRTSPEWDEHTMPVGLRRSHRLAAAIWGRIRVHAGRLQFSMASQPPMEIELLGDTEQAIPPEIFHEIRPLGSVRFVVDFLAVDRSGERHPRSPVDQGGDPACWAGLICPECGAVLEEAHHRAGCSQSGFA